MNSGSISIIMPSYNTAKYIAESMQSVLNQTYINWELIIADDYSTDNTEEIVSRFNYKRIKQQSCCFKKSCINGSKRSVGGVRYGKIQCSDVFI